jgi:starch phosphorylase
MRLDTFQVVPALPERLAGLREMAFNLLWSWDDELRQIFTRVDREMWEKSAQNPVLMLGLVSQQRLDELSRDDGFLSLYERTLRHFRGYLEEPTWWDKRYGERPLVAYFSAEYGLSEALPIYSGGLGVLSGHHLKSASDLGVPLVGVGLLYQQGYFHQYLSSDGWQQESYRDNDFFNLPVQPALAASGQPLQVELALAGQALLVKVWRVEVGRLPLFLLDTNLPENPAGLRDITDQLYGGDQETRIQQEIVLGMGGLQALHALGLDPVVCHLNEGHSAFLALERLRGLMRGHQLSFREALEVVRAGAVFTTHTPVPAGFDLFTPELMEKYFGPFCQEAGLTREELLALGRDDGETPGRFNMAGLALRTSALVNGVSRLHGAVSRRLLRKFAPQVPEDEMPIGHVTNGVHTRSCVSKDMTGLFDRYMGPEWWRRPGEAATWEGVDAIPDEELWATHERRRERLVAFARRRLVRQLERRGASPRDVERARGVLNTRALTIGFARRFATYKRATLLLQDLERLRRIMLDPERPVQFIFAGKAHPKDQPGKEMLKAVVHFCQSDEFRRHAVFLEDYDIVTARYLVQGVDVWLNTPRRGLEASGTSGMKVLPNGGLNLSVPDGWWCEVDDPQAGWSIGQGEEYADHAYQDSVESSALYDLLAKEIVPLYYARAQDGLPRAWIQRMKRSLRTLSPTFSTNRMLWEYGERYYLPAARHHAELCADGFARARAVAAWKQRVEAAWAGVRVESVNATEPGARKVGEGFAIEARVRLDGHHVYAGVVPCLGAGLLGYGVRVRPAHPDAGNLLATGFMTWWE